VGCRLILSNPQLIYIRRDYDDNARQALRTLPVDRNTKVLAASLFALAMGEELWQAYMPAYLTALGASGIVVGLYGSSKDLLDSLYQVPGGLLTDRLGRRRALLIFTALAGAGYAIYAVAPSWPFVMVGLIAVMAWKAGAFPTTFAVIGDALPPGRRGTAFAIQSVLVRVPRVVSAPLGGLAIAAMGLLAGIRATCAITAMIAVCIWCLQYGWIRERSIVAEPTTPRLPPHGRLPSALRRLLAADCVVRIGEGLAASFIVLYVTEVRGVSVAFFGVLYAVQQSIAIAFYLPGGRLADLAGRRWVIAMTFLFFAAFPVAVRSAATDAQLVLAFVIGGLKEIGEPARKSLIVDLAPTDRRGSTVGVYYAIRNALVVPAGLMGGLLWQYDRALPLEAAGVVCLVGLVVFLITSRHHSTSFTTSPSSRTS
jgi:predicted MFS family arabinose efflux permease